MRPSRLLTTLALPAVLAASSPALQLFDFPNLYGTPGWETQLGAGPNLNAMIGANRFYAAGYTGSRSVVANIEENVVSPYPEAMGNLRASLTSPTVTPIASAHATITSFLAAGRYSGLDDGRIFVGDDFSTQGIADPNNYVALGIDGHIYQDGIAYGSALWSGAYGGRGTGGDYVMTATSFTTPFLTAMSGGVNGRTADVISGSWGIDSEDPPEPLLVAGGRWLNAMAAQNPGTTLVFAAGNRGETTGELSAPATNDNAISVGSLALGDYAHAYETVHPISSFAPADYDGLDGHVAGVRARVDLVAQGRSIWTPAFHDDEDTYYPEGTGPNVYDTTDGATSFSTPIVSGAVSLLKDVAHDRFAADPNALDTRVVKAVLMNSADKLAGWDNGQAMVGGVLTTTQALDYAQGTGRLNLSTAFDGFTAGTTDLSGLGGGSVDKTGWDFGSVADGGFNDYALGALVAGGSLTTTLVWFADVSTTGLDDGLGVSQGAFTNLDLQVLRDGTLVAQSNAAYITTQHLSFALAESGNYTIRVRWAGDRYDFINKTNTPYGLAWRTQAVPEPASMLALGMGAAALLRRRRRG